MSNITTITTKFIFVFDCLQDMKVFYQTGEFIRSTYLDFATYFIDFLPVEYTAIDYMAHLKHKYAKYLNMSDSDFKIDELEVDTKISGIREVEVKIKRRNIPTTFILLIDSIHDRKVIESGQFISSAIFYYDVDPENPNGLRFVESLPDTFNSLDYIDFIKKNFSEYLTEFDFHIKDFDYGKNRIIKVQVERKKEMKNMFYDNLSEPVFADYEPIKGYFHHATPKITLRDFYLEPSAEQYPYVSMTFNISPGVITEDTQFSIKRYLDDAYTRISRNSGRYPFKETLNGGYMKKAPLTFKLYSGVERASQRYKTICVWEDGEKTTIYCNKPVNGAPVARAFAWCYVKRTFGTVSHFKKHVDKRTTKIGGVIYFEGDCIQDDYAQASVGQDWILYDIYDAAALAITAKRYGGLKKLNDDYIQKAVDIDADLRKAEDGVKAISEVAEKATKSLNHLAEVLDDTKKKKTKKTNK